MEATTKFRAGPAKAAWLQPRPQQPQRRRRRRRQDDSTTNEEEEEDGPLGGSSSSSMSSSISSSSSNFLLELIEIPSFLLEEEEESNLPPTARPTTPKKAPDLLKHATVLGLNHIALDVTSSIRQSLEESKKKNGDASSGKDGEAAAVVGGGGGTKKGGLLSAWLEELNQQSVDRFGKTLRVAVKPYQTMIGNGVYELAFLYDADGTLIELLFKQTELPQDIGSGWDPTERIEFQQ